MKFETLTYPVPEVDDVAIFVAESGDFNLKELMKGMSCIVTEVDETERTCFLKIRWIKEGETKEAIQEEDYFDNPGFTYSQEKQCWLIDLDQEDWDEDGLLDEIEDIELEDTEEEEDE